MTSRFDHRIIATNDAVTHEILLTVHEVWYGENNVLLGYSEEPTAIDGISMTELNETLSSVTRAFSLPFLTPADFPRVEEVLVLHVVGGGMALVVSA